MNGICDPSSKATKRYREEEERPPLLRLEILSGPSSGREITIDDADTQVSQSQSYPKGEHDASSVDPIS